MWVTNTWVKLLENKLCFNSFELRMENQGGEVFYQYRKLLGSTDSSLPPSPLSSFIFLLENNASKPLLSDFSQLREIVHCLFEMGRKSFFLQFKSEWEWGLNILIRWIFSVWLPSFWSSNISRVLLHILSNALLTQYGRMQGGEDYVKNKTNTGETAEKWTCETIKRRTIQFWS